MLYESQIKIIHWDGSYDIRNPNDKYSPIRRFCKHGILRPSCKRCHWWKHFWTKVVFWFSDRRAGYREL